jgi:Flp pilus assembly CpaF family ATPase
MKELIGEAVDVVVFLKRQARDSKGPVVAEILEVKGVDIKNSFYKHEFQ